MNRTIGNLFALMLVALIAAAGAQAFMGQFRVDSEDRQALLAAIENSDYDAWKSLMAQQLTEENFNAIVEEHRHRTDMMNAKEQLNAAIADGDYDAYVSATEALASVNERLSTPLSEENFKIFVEIQDAREAGDIETARQLAEESGIGFGRAGTGFGHKGMHMVGGWV